MQLLNDSAIRSAFKSQFRPSRNESLLDELDLIRGKSRVDLIHFGEFVTGYEIKSDVDTLYRLATQAETYNRSLEKIVLISGAKHSDDLLEVLPSWWGLVVARATGKKISFREIRSPNLSPYFDHSCLLDLLWKVELEQILEVYGFNNLQSKTKFDLKTLIKRVAPYREIKRQIINLINHRKDLSPAARAR